MGALQAVLGSRGRQFSFYVLGFLMMVGAKDQEGFPLDCPNGEKDGPQDKERRPRQAVPQPLHGVSSPWTAASFSWMMARQAPASRLPR